MLYLSEQNLVQGIFPRRRQSMSETRERILRLLLERQRCSVNEIAEAVGINPISVRHHINKLEAEGLIAWEDQRHGIGRPRRVYYLTEAGLEKFPSRYVQLTVRLLKQLKATLPQEVVARLFRNMAQEVAAQLAEGIDLEKLGTAQRLDLLARLLEREGFTVEWEDEGDRFILREKTCPYYRVGQEHPEICLMDEALIATVLDIPAEKVECILDGDQMCTYSIPKSTLGEAP